VKPAVVLPESGGDVLLRQPHGFEGVRVVSGARFVSGQAGDGLENEYRADPENEPVPHTEALVYPFTDGDSNDESEGADRPPVTNARLRPSHALPPRWIPIERFISARRLGHNRVVEGEREGARSGFGVSVLLRQPHGFEGFGAALIADRTSPRGSLPRRQF
jgi:hypothetical protein